MSTATAMAQKFGANLKASNDEKRNAATIKYRQLLSRTDDASPKEMESLQTVMDVLNLSTGDLEKDARDFEAAAELRRQIVPDDVLERLHAEGEKKISEVQAELRTACKSIIDLFPPDALLGLFDQLSLVAGAFPPGTRDKFIDRVNAARTKSQREQSFNDERLKRLDRLTAGNPRVFG